MRLTVVGCSGSFAGPESAASCYLVEAPYDGRIFRLILDLGSGALGALQRHVALVDVDAVALSHLHPDHCIDLCGFYVVRKYNPGGHMGRLDVFGPAGTGARLARAYDMEPGLSMEDEFAFHEYADHARHPIEVGPFELQVVEVDHPVTAYAIRVRDGDKSLVYTGDTGPCAALAELADGADLLLAEASFLAGVDNPEHVHLTGEDAAQVATKAGVDRLVLTHIPPWHSVEQVLADASGSFDGSIQLAHPGLVVDV